VSPALWTTLTLKTKSDKEETGPLSDWSIIFQAHHALQKMLEKK
jgi:hypothetical protein